MTPTAVVVSVLPEEIALAAVGDRAVVAPGKAGKADESNSKLCDLTMSFT